MTGDNNIESDVDEIFEDTKMNTEVEMLTSYPELAPLMMFSEDEEDTEEPCCIVSDVCLAGVSDHVEKHVERHNICFDPNVDELDANNNEYNSNIDDFNIDANIDEFNIEVSKNKYDIDEINIDADIDESNIN